MRRAGIGLKPLIALHLVVVLGVLAVLLSYAAVRLIRHGLTTEQVHWARALLEDAARRLPSVCPRLATEGCPALDQVTAGQPSSFGSLLVLSVHDQRGKLLATTDPELAAKALWDAFGVRTSGGERGQDWSIWERDGRRVLVVNTAPGEAGWWLRGSFSLVHNDETAGRLAHSLYLYAALLAAVTMLLGWVLLYRLIVRPLDRLLSSADRISEGDLGFLTASERGSELGRLGRSFSQMARRIERDQQRMRDQIEELTALNRQLHQAQQGLVRSEKLASVGRLAAGLAHEVGNPISAVLGYVEMLRTESIPPDEQRDILARVEREVERVDTVIQDLLAYSRPGRDNVQPAEPAALVEDAMALIRPQKKYKQVAFQVEVPGDLPPVLADPDLVRQVLVNLMLNALDAVGSGGHVWVRAVHMTGTAGGGVAWPGDEGDPAFFSLGRLHEVRPPRDGTGLGPGDEAVVFCVVDDGAGIPASEIERIFDPFYTSKEPGKGTGLGLAISHAAIDAQGGEIWVYSRQGEGSQLAFYLPVAPDGPGT